MRKSSMQLTTSSLQGVPLLILAGDVGHENCPELRRIFEDMLHDGIDRFLLDLSEVEHIDSGCIGLMWVLFNAVAGHGWIGVIGANANIRRILSVAGLVEDGAFRVFAAQADAEVALTA